MAYIAKNTILKAYEVLSSIDNDKRQGLTQKVSALKYGIALAMYFNQNNKNCDLKDTDNKDTFSSLVGRVVKINEKQCTKDFYTSIAPNGRDYDCGSNFYSQSSVKDSRTNTEITILYPKRSGWQPVMEVSNQVLIYKPDFIKDSINFYLSSSQLKFAFVIWLLRFENIETKDVSGLKKALGRILTDAYCDALFSDIYEDTNYLLVEYDDMKCELMDTDIKNMFTDNKDSRSLAYYSHQQIFYGAPGTGKSHEIKIATKGKSVIRTTFHPDSDYSTFVGAYKPTMEDTETMVVPVVVNNGISLQEKGTIVEKRIVYKFIMQAFLKAYLGAWKKYADRMNDEADPQFLVIEEINRGNCAQIFGDLFQLLDRNDEHFSEYPIESDTDLQKEIERAFKEHKNYKLEHDIEVEDIIEDYTSNYDSTLSEDIQHGRVLLLPPNLYIWATMNTSDQSLFPIDSAFKRRWEWKYMKIKNEGKEWKIDVRIKDADGVDKPVKWWDFIRKVNDIIASMTSSADKQLGYFFCKADKKTPERANESNSENDLISVESFVSKVLFYLWNDVFKDYGFEDASLFQYTKKTEDGKETKKDLTFPDFYKEDSNDVNSTMVTDFVQKVMNWKKKEEEKS